MLYTPTFNDYLVNVRGFSPLTAKVYLQCLCKFDYYMQVMGIPCERDLSELDAARFFVFCSKEQGLQAKTINLHRSALTSYYAFCVKFHCYPCNPFAETEPMREAKKLPHWIDEDTIKSVIGRFQSNTLQDTRDKFIILLLSHCGLRSGEVCNLRVEDVNSSEVIVHGKGNKMRVVPISAAVREAWQAYMKFRVGIVSPFLLLCADNSQLTHSAVYKLVRRAFINDCPSEDCHPHALRHSFATICMLHNVPISNIAHLMGHASEATTLKYFAVIGKDQNPFDKF